jgi:hypothetical protein
VKNAHGIRAAPEIEGEAWQNVDGVAGLLLHLLLPVDLTLHTGEHAQ